MPKKRKTWMWQLLLSLFFCVVILITYANQQAKWRIEKAKERLSLQPIQEYEQLIDVVTQDEVEASSESTTLSPEIIDEARSRLKAYAEAAEYLDKNINDLDNWNNLREILFDTWTDEQWQMAEEFLAEHAGLIQQLRFLAELKGPLYPTNLNDFPNFGEGHLEYLKEVRSFGSLLALDARIQAHKGSIDTAILDISTQLRIARGVSNEPVLISNMVGNAVQSVAFSTVVSAFEPGTLSTEQYTELIDHFASSNSLDSMAASLNYEVYTGASMLYSGPGWLNVIGLGSVFQNFRAARHLETMIPLVESAELPYYQAQGVLSNFDDVIEDLPFYAIETCLIAPALVHTLESQGQYEAQIGLVQVGLTLENYFTTHGNYPDTLDAIAPMLGEYVIDPFTGKPFIYHPNDESFTLYSVGVNLEDDSGMHDYRDGDIVWRGQ